MEKDLRVKEGGGIERWLELRKLNGVTNSLM